MRGGATRPLRWLGALLALYLCAPFVASVPELGHADWANVDWSGTWSALGISAASASVAALVILLGGVPLGYLLARSRSRTLAWLGFVVQLPLALPPLTSGVLLLFLFGPYSWIGRFTNGLLTDSFAGIVLAQTFVAAPFLIIAARSAFAAVDPVYDDVAATLGHRAGSRFFRILLPIAWPGIRAGLALAWLRAFGEFGATVMLAYHPYSLPVYTYVVFGGQGLPAMMPLLLPTLAVAVAFAALSLYRRRRRGAIHSDEPGEASPLAAASAAAVDADADAAAAAPAGETCKLAFHLCRRLGGFSLDIDWAPTTRRLAIIGPSGSGKSLALRLLAGLEPNQGGTIRLGACELGDLPPEQRKIAYMPQDYGLFPHLNVARQLAFPVDADAASARYWVGHLGLDALLERLPGELSFGQRQRVALARALTRHSRLLLFDEPFAALDTPRRRSLQQSLCALQRELSAVTVMVTHDPDEAALLADEVLVLEQGRVLQCGPIEAVFARPASLRVAELLGLYNVGEGVVREPGWIETTHGLPLATMDRSLAPGQAVMWRVAAGAVQLSPDGAFTATVDTVALRHGERYVRLRIGEAFLDIASEDPAWRQSSRHRLGIEPSGVSVWPRTRPRATPA